MKICFRLTTNFILSVIFINSTTAQYANSTERNALYHSNRKALYTTPQASDEKIRKLTNLNQIAELEFVTGDLSKAYLNYQSIGEFALDAVWPENIRKIIFQSFFRRAQIKKDEESVLITKAAIFAFDLEPNFETTPKKLIQIFDLVKSHPDFISIYKDPTVNYMINGSELISKVHKEKIYRLDLFPKDKSHFSDFIVGSKLAKFKFDTDKIKSKEPKKDKPRALPLKITPTFELNNQFDITSTNYINPKKDGKNNNNKWIYIATSVVAVTLGAVLINQRNDKPSSYEPTSRQGFEN